MGSKIVSLIVVEAIRGRCASFEILTATVLEIFSAQANSSILVVGLYIVSKSISVGRPYSNMRQICFLMQPSPIPDDGDFYEDLLFCSPSSVVKLQYNTIQYNTIQYNIQHHLFPT